jgi:hypothetical protein
VVVGGIKCKAADVAEALAVLASSAGMMVAQPLRKARSVLAECDYHSAAAAQKAAVASKLAHAGRGAAGRHITKTAFCMVLTEVLKAARRAAPFWPVVTEALRAFASDVCYAEAMCALAMKVKAGISGGLLAPV